MLKLRAATVVETLDTGDDRETRAAGRERSSAGAEQRLVIELTSDVDTARRREAIADVALVGRAEVGDEVVVNVEALDLGLDSGGFDVVHVNLTRGLDAENDLSRGLPHAMKLNYTSLQHAVNPVEREHLQLPVGRAAAVLALHGQLAGVAWAFAQAAPGARLGYVQTEGGALPGGSLVGTQRCAVPGRGSSARARRSGTAAWSRSTRRTSRSRSAVPRCWSRACPQEISAHATAAYPTTR
jgi:hypothetical protein